MSNNPWWQQFWSFLPDLVDPPNNSTFLLAVQTISLDFEGLVLWVSLNELNPIWKKKDKLNFICNLLQIWGVGGWWGSLNIPNHQGCSTCLCPGPSFFQPNNSWIHWSTSSSLAGQVSWTSLLRASTANFSAWKNWPKPPLKLLEVMVPGQVASGDFVEAVARVGRFFPRKKIFNPEKTWKPGSRVFF